MNTYEISQLRIAGKIQEAYIECKTLLAQFSDDRDVRITMAWCLKSLAEKSAKEKDTSRFVEILNELADLRLAEIGEFSVTNSFSWDIKVLFDLLKTEPDTLVSTANQILAISPKLSFAKPHKYYSMLGDAFSKVKGRQASPWPRFTEFMDWFGFDNLRQEDYNRIPLKEPGRSLPSVAERLHSAYYKALRDQIESGQINESAIESFLARLTKLNELHPEYQFTLYHKSLLLLALNRKEEALVAIRPFVKRKQNEFWVWDVLSETTDNPDIKLSCCCRALLCRTDQKFLGKIHLKTAKLMHTLGYDGNARTEIRVMYKTYQENGWRMLPEAIDLARQPWYQAAVALESNSEFYREHLSASEEFLFLDTPKIPILITYYNHEKRICNFVTADKKRGFFSTKQIRGRFSKNHIYLVRLESNIVDGRISKVVSYNQVEDIRPYVGVFFKKIEGILRFRDGNSFGFVDDIYIDQRYFPKGISNGSRVTGTAIISYNQRKEAWGWKAVSLKAGSIN